MGWIPPPPPPPPYLLLVVLLAVSNSDCCCSTQHTYNLKLNRSILRNIRDQGSGYDPGTCHRLAAYLCFVVMFPQLYHYINTPVGTTPDDLKPVTHLSKTPQHLITNVRCYYYCSFTKWKFIVYSFFLLIIIGLPMKLMMMMMVTTITMISDGHLVNGRSL